MKTPDPRSLPGLDGRAIATLGLALLAAAAPAHAQTSAAGMAVAKLVWGYPDVERTAEDHEAWRRLEEGSLLRTGDRLRTEVGSVARLDFPWMTVTLGPSTILSVPASAVLSTVLEQGRAEFSGEGRDIVKIEVGGGEIRGGGRLVVWREGERTAAAALAGAFRVSGAGGTVEIRAGEGTTLVNGEAPRPAAPLPAPPEGLVPDGDPAYLVSGESAELRWTPEGPAYYVSVLALQSDDVLLARNAVSPPLRLEIPWLGTFRWRVSARDARGLESPPSDAGYVVVVER